MRIVEYWGWITSHKCLVIRAREENESGKSERVRRGGGKQNESENESEKQKQSVKKKSLTFLPGIFYFHLFMD